MSIPEVRVVLQLPRAGGRDRPRRRRWLGLVLIGAMLALVVPGAPAHAATPQDGYWSKDGLVKGEFPAIVFFYVRGGGTRIEQLNGYFGPPQPIVGACSRTLTDAGPVAVAPDGSFSYVNPNLTLSGRFTASNRAEGTYSYTDACGRVRRGPFPFFVDLHRAEAPVRYRVELKTWIPHHDVVDPLRPVSMGYLAFKASPEAGCTHPPVRHWLNAVVSSRYRGDDHLDYPGSDRARVWVEFDWNGERITNLVHREEYVTTHRDLLYEWNRA